MRKLLKLNSLKVDQNEKSKKMSKKRKHIFNELSMRHSSKENSALVDFLTHKSSLSNEVRYYLKGVVKNIISDPADNWNLVQWCILDCPQRAVSNEFRFLLFIYLRDIYFLRKTHILVINELIYKYLLIAHPGKSGAAFEAAYFLTWEFQDDAGLMTLLKVAENGKTREGRGAAYEGIYSYFESRNRMNEAIAILIELRKREKSKLGIATIESMLGRIQSHGLNLQGNAN